MAKGDGERGALLPVSADDDGKGNGRGGAGDDAVLFRFWGLTKPRCPWWEGALGAIAGCSPKDFSDPRDADDARYHLDDRELNGSRLIVEFAKGVPRGPEGSREYMGRGPPSGSSCCFNCGIDGHWACDCKAGDWKNRCYRCGERGHIERDCQNNPKNLSRSPLPRRNSHDERSPRDSRSPRRSPRDSSSPRRSKSPSPSKGRDRSPRPTGSRSPAPRERNDSD